jgi:hypothetical protein
MVSADRLDDILSGIEKVKQDKPYADDAEAIAALDWISAATADVTGALGRSAEDTSAMATLQELLNSLEALHSSVTAAMKRAGQDVPRRHDDVPAATVNPG